MGEQQLECTVQQLENSVQALTDRVDALEEILREFVADIEYTFTENETPFYPWDTHVLFRKHLGAVDCKMRDSKSENKT